MQFVTRSSIILQQVLQELNVLQNYKRWQFVTYTKNMSREIKENVCTIII